MTNEQHAGRIALHLKATGERFADEEYVRHEIKCALDSKDAENERLRAALNEIIELEHYPDATIARKALGKFHEQRDEQK
jgi:hypothetical protein